MKNKIRRKTMEWIIKHPAGYWDRMMELVESNVEFKALIDNMIATPTESESPRKPNK
tara:strand:+ start:533 stop:703 length:171 start_codon:yes stop_codon:yes gene_type:complete